MQFLNLVQIEIIPKLTTTPLNIYYLNKLVISIENNSPHFESDDAPALTLRLAGNPIESTRMKTSFPQVRPTEMRVPDSRSAYYLFYLTQFHSLSLPLVWPLRRVSVSHSP